jgi:hypothetical protein
VLDRGRGRGRVRPSPLVDAVLLADVLNLSGVLLQPKSLAMPSCRATAKGFCIIKCVHACSRPPTAATLFLTSPVLRHPWCLLWSNVRVQVRMPEGDSVVLDDSDAPSSSSSRRQKAGAAAQGDVIDAEFRDLQ